eukprot:gene5255-3766_t
MVLQAMTYSLLVVLLHASYTCVHLTSLVLFLLSDSLFNFYWRPHAHVKRKGTEKKNGAFRDRNMSFELLNDVEVEKCFASIRRLAAALEGTSLSRVNNVDKGLLAQATQAGPGRLPAVGGLHSTSDGTTTTQDDDELLFIPNSLSLPKICGQDVVTVLSKLGHSLTMLVDRLQRQTDTHFVAFFDHMKKKEFSELEEICSKRRIVPQGFVTHTQLVGHAFPSSGALDEPSQIGIEAALPLAEEQSPLGGTVNSGFELVHTHSTFTDGGRGGGGQLRNAPLARKLKERREAASTLQTFIFLVLESCIAQCEGSCAAIFLNGLSYKGQGKDNSRSASKGTFTEEIDREAPPRFLHCVANLYGEGKFPNEISYATLNPLTAVVQTGVAVNLRNTECPQLPTVDGEHRDMGTDDVVSESLKKNINKVLNINSGIMLPLGDFGCVVLANKRSTAIVNSFTLSDEHVMWGAALFLSTVLTRYKRELLLENPWYPSHIPQLRRFITLPTVKDGQKDKRAYVAPEVETALESNFGVLANNLMTFITEGKGANMPRRLTIVRTADPQTGHVVPVELLPRNRVPTAVCEHVTEEEIFQGAAQYISNLESLWHKTLAENNAAHLVMQNYDKEVESRNEEIRLLEAKIRKLNTRITDNPALSHPFCFANCNKGGLYVLLLATGSLTAM